MPNHHQRAFTLIELLIVITIIGILAIALLPKVANMPSRGRDTQRKADLSQVTKALEGYFSDYGVYPSNPIVGGSTKYCVDAVTSLPNYFNVSDIPNDPSGNSGGVSATITGCSNAATYGSAGEYYYKKLDSGQHYVVGADLENEPASGTITANIVKTTTVTGATSLGDISDIASLYSLMQTGEDCASIGCMFVLVK